MVVPSPIWPKRLEPQHLAVSLACSEHVWPLPLETVVPLARPVTVTGVVRLVGVLSPSGPGKVQPQHRAVPSTSHGAVLSRAPGRGHHADMPVECTYYTLAASWLIWRVGVVGWVGTCT